MRKLLDQTFKTRMQWPFYQHTVAQNVAIKLCCYIRTVWSQTWFAFSALTLLVGRQEGHPVCKNWVVGAGVVIGLEQGADLHMAQLMQLPLTVSCFSKIQISFTFLVPAHLGSPRQRAVKRVCVIPDLNPNSQRMEVRQHNLHSAKILIYFSSKIYRSNFTKQHPETVMV